MEFITGESRDQSIVLYVGDDNSVRVVDAYITAWMVSALGFSRPQPHDTGRPMYDPKDLLKLSVYGYMNGVRSSRRLETERGRNLEAMRLLGAIANFRREKGAALERVFRDFVGVCVKLGL
jgi:transposase